MTQLKLHGQHRPRRAGASLAPAFALAGAVISLSFTLGSAFAAGTSSAPASAAPAVSAKPGTCADLKPLELAVRLKPGDSTALIALGQAYVCAGRYRDAQDTLENAVAMDYRSFDAHFQLARTLYEQGDLDAALFEYTQLTALYPDRFEPLYNTATVLSRLRRPDDAIKAYGAAIDAAKAANAPAAAVVDAYVGLAGQQRLKKDLDGAAKSYADAQTYQPGAPMLILGQARALLDAGKGPQALPLAFSLTAQDPSNAQAAILVADVFDAQNLPDRALKELDRALTASRRAVDKAALNVRRGVILEKSGRAAEAIVAYRSAAKANPNSFEAQYDLGNATLATKPTDALAAFREATRLNPGDGAAQLGVAFAQDAVGNHSAAYSAALRAQPLLSVPAMRVRAQMLAGKNAYLTGQYANAAAQLRGVMAADAQNADAPLWLGLAQFAQKDYSGAIISLETAVKLAPNSLSARSDLGAAYYAAHRYGDAEAVLRIVVQADPKNPDAQTNLGLALANLNRLDEARLTLKTAADLGSALASSALKSLGSR